MVLFLFVLFYIFKTGKLMKENKTSNNEFLERSICSINENLFRLNASVMKISDEKKEFRVFMNDSEKQKNDSNVQTPNLNLVIESGANDAISK